MYEPIYIVSIPVCMITIIGTGHVYKLAEPVSFIVKNTWPDAVLIELDMSRYNTLMANEQAISEGGEVKGNKEMSPLMKQTAEYQQKIAKKNDTQVGGEFLAAVNSGRLAGAEIIPIDTDAMSALEEMWDEMSFSERTRYKLSGIADSLGGLKRVKKVHKDFSEDEVDYVEAMRRKYPTMVRKLIDERNEYMANQISSCSERFSNMVVVVGDAHVEGICALLKDDNIRKIRLNDLLDPERMNKVRDMVWKGDCEL